MKLAVTTRCGLMGILLGIAAPFSLAQEHPGPTLTSAHKPVRSLLLGECSDVYFFYIGRDEGRHIEIYSMSANDDRFLFIGTILPEGGPPMVESVFFRNADADPDKEMFVLAKWHISHPGLNTSGNFYRTYVYDQEVKPGSGGLKRLGRIEERLGEGFDGVREGREVEFSVKTAKDVDRLLGATDD